MLSFGQESVKIKNEISNLFAKADKKNLQNVLPFEINNRTGLIDAHSKKTILSPIEEFQINVLFNPVMKGYYKGYEFEIDSKDFKITVTKNATDTMDLVPVLDCSPSENSRNNPIVSTENNFKGFSVDEKGNLQNCSDIYKEGSFKDVYPFKYKGKYYAIAKKKMTHGEKRYGIIDTEGNSLPGFDFIHEGISLNELASNDDNAWFIINGQQNYSCDKLLEKSSFMSIKGEEKLKGEFPNYPSADIFGIEANASGCLTFTGVLDVEKMEWIVKPQSKIKIRWMDYTSKVALNIKNTQDKSKAKIYVKVLDDDAIYYMDLDLKNKYFPIKKS